MIVVDNYIVFAEQKDVDYETIRSIILNKPQAPQGYQYKLRADTLEWELVELPEPIDTDDEATESDYIEALQDLGVDVN